MKTRHEELRDRITRMYEERGYVVRREVRVGGKSVDLVAENDGEALLVEVLDFDRGPITDSELETSQVVTRLKKGSYILKWQLCGKHCSGCPHGPYVYQVTRKEGKQIWKYMGKAKDLRDLKDLVRKIETS